MKVENMGNSKNPRFNSEGYHDPTAYEALKPIIKEDIAIQNKLNKLITDLKLVIDLSGFELIGRIQLKHRKSGKEFRLKISQKIQHKGNF